MDKAAAFAWYRRAALHPIEGSHLALGYIYSLGDGTPVDMIEAYAHFHVAIDLAMGGSIAHLCDELAAKMDPDDVPRGIQRGEEILKAVNEWGHGEGD